MEMRISNALIAAEALEDIMKKKDLRDLHKNLGGTLRAGTFADSVALMIFADSKIAVKYGPKTTIISL